MRADYHRATRNAYRTLLATKTDDLPVDVERICELCRDTMLISFRDMRELMGWDFDPFFDGPSRSAVTLRQHCEDGTRHLIVWNDEELDRGGGLFRLAVAHELGHVVLKHPGGLNPESELEANCYAMHLLCPRPVLEVLQPKDSMEISYLCRVTAGAAREALVSLRQDNLYVDRDIWTGIFEAFSLDERRNTQDFLPEITMRLLERRRARGIW